MFKVEIFDRMNFEKRVKEYSNIEEFVGEHIVSLHRRAELYDQNKVFGYQPSNAYLKVKTKKFKSMKEAVENVNNAEYNCRGGKVLHFIRLNFQKIAFIMF